MEWSINVEDKTGKTLRTRCTKCLRGEDDVWLKQKEIMVPSKTGTITHIALHNDVCIPEST